MGKDTLPLNRNFMDFASQTIVLAGETELLEQDRLLMKNANAANKKRGRHLRPR